MDSSINDQSISPKKELKTLITKTESYNYNILQTIGSGSFGVVYQAKCVETDEFVAIKKVFQDKRYKNRELQILKELNHPNIIKLKNSFYTPAEKANELYLNVVMDYISDTMSRVIRQYAKNKQDISMILVKLYAYQMLRSISYIHSSGICHRDIKPQNILVDIPSHIVKLCDFGSAKKLARGDVNVAYICSRYYRAPELIFGATEYSNSVDIWSVGCVIAELVLGYPLFPGESAVDQIVEIIKVLGTPTRKQIIEMNPYYTEYKFPIIKSFSFKHIYKNKNVPNEFIDLLYKLLAYEPQKRLRPLEAMLHPFFDELRVETTTLPNGKNIPEIIFHFTDEEYSKDTSNIIRRLIPDWYTSKTAKG